MNLDSVTIQDCLDMYEKKGCVALIHDGKLICFFREFGGTKIGTS